MSGSEFNFPSFDHQLMVDSIDIASQAKDDAGFEIPDANSKTLSPTEITIVRVIQSFYNKGLEGTNRGSIEARLQTYNSLRQADGHAGQIGSLESELKALYAQSKNNIQTKFNKYKKDRDYLRFFQKENKLYDAASLKSGNAKLISLLIVFGMFIFETSVNTGFLTGSITGGILGALSLAGVISFINIIASFLIGRFVIPNFYHVKRSRVNLASLVMLIYTPLVIYINCALGVFRSLSQVATETFNSEMFAQAAMQAAWPFNDFSTNSVESNALIIIGLLFAVIAILDGFYFDEPYPSYAKVTKKANESEELFESAKQDAFDLLFRKQKAGNDQITAYKDKRQAANQSWAQTIDSIQAGFSTYPSWVNSLKTQGNAYINEYRAENKRYRSSKAPDYFDDLYDFDFIDDPNIQFRSLVSANIEDSEKDKSFDESNKIITSEYNNAIADVNKIYGAVLTGYEEFLENLMN